MMILVIMVMFNDDDSDDMNTGGDRVVDWDVDENICWFVIEDEAGTLVRG